LLFISRVRLDKLRRFVKENKRDYAPKSPISLLFIFNAMLKRLNRLAKGDNKHYAPLSPI